jgi:hypothetical protein
MYATIIVAISCAISIAFLSKANIRITINHTYPQQPVDKVDNSTADLQKTIDEAYEKSELPTFDDVLKMAQEMIGGDNDAD